MQRSVACALGADDCAEGTDVDNPRVHKFNGVEFDMHLHIPWEAQEVETINRYCFTCLRQLHSGGRALCGVCNRWVYRNCGQENPEQRHSLAFICCSCSAFDKLMGGDSMVQDNW